MTRLINSQGIRDEKANSYYQKAKENYTIEERLFKKSYLNPQQEALIDAIGEKMQEKIWRNDCIEVKMTNNLLRNRLLDLTEDIQSVSTNDYNFKDRKLTKPGWIKDMDEEEEKKKKRFEKHIKRETYEPHVTPRDDVRDPYLQLQKDLKRAIQHKRIEELESLVPQAIDKYPMELELLICHGELIIKNFKDIQSQKQIELQKY